MLNTLDHLVFRQANNPETPIDILISLDDSDDEIILAARAYNSSTPLDVIEKLRQKNIGAVSDCLRKRGIL